MKQIYTIEQQKDDENNQEKPKEKALSPKCTLPKVCCTEQKTIKPGKKKNKTQDQILKFINIMFF